MLASAVLDLQTSSCKISHAIPPRLKTLEQ